MATPNYEGGIVATDSGGDEFIYNDLIITGAVYWVDSVNGSDSNAGTEEFPFQTLSAAVTAATASSGDIIILKSGHSQTLSSSQSIAKAGLKIYGLGTGSSKATINTSANIDILNITANDVEINGVRFTAGTTTANTARINIDAARVKVKSCVFLCGAYDANTITITANGVGATIESCTFTVSADGPDSGILIESASAHGVKLISNSFNGGTYGWDDAAVYSASAHLQFHYEENTLTSKAHIVHTAAAKGWCSGTVAGDNCRVSI